MPAVLWHELADHFAAVDRGVVAERSLAGLPCLWYHAATARCRHYEWRPAVCRTFRPGSPACEGHRRAMGLRQLASD